MYVCMSVDCILAGHIIPNIKYGFGNSLRASYTDLDNDYELSTLWLSDWKGFSF